jgi:hypothetical protein
VGCRLAQAAAIHQQNRKRKGLNICITYNCTIVTPSPPLSACSYSKETTGPQLFR